MWIRSNHGRGGLLQFVQLPLNLRLGLLLILGIGALCSCQYSGERTLNHAEPNSLAVNDCRDCLAAYTVNGWCQPCDRGFVAMIPIDSREFHDALDAHGHEVPGNSLQCQVCQQAYDEDQFCPRCNHGYVSGKLYFSRLSWSLARGELIERELSCEGCSGTDTSPTQLDSFPDRCSECFSWSIGNRQFLTIEGAQQAWNQLQRLAEALRREQDCHNCGLHSFFGYSCPNCGIGPIPEA